MELTVVKKDGSLESFNKDKIDRIMVAAGLDPEISLALSDEISNWAENLGQDKITTAQIRDKVVEELKRQDKYAADFYVWYEKSKERDSKQ
ncbi:hypothetical protein A3D00_01825 [Candidatus Woesebacteria bacterium RIFCSPHIGHO2_02_FULL_38_9]|uniref:ATP-cone domain-containing protein n=1 Tax=Candidatus Woesebacteria bacterium RIFCSPHIGHO2_01_FULL_39_28 TaxID=1802496 RepID=A0A1F7YHX5_9BACT|nr:MAG: hypothetical protein A2627_03630 [Candidatus Woesebacteria bacterium RIFCSPHIGHO2_01_FULL_39_28]OGM33666.1 MAG: hypothetical protein A3D00_01825 [Candidatus Woesebacteria bacterium RIFCSPHIGHO2_02_FULL_38_9]OGM58513.1 MAG: hypothetical protein A3A50_00640 [Candidatus Woesebacteria bacterium RIFCSPLOWO2_01_FULL_38_20]